MFKKLATVVFVLAFAAACQGKKVEEAATTGAGTVVPPVAAETNTIAPGSQAELESIGDRVFFDFDKATLSAEGQAQLARQAEWLKTYPNVHVTVEGHCDERGTREYNLALGERRATSAKNFLVSAGVAADRIATISYGKERPAVVGSTEESFAQNRRAVTVVTQ